MTDDSAGPELKTVTRGKKGDRGSVTDGVTGARMKDAGGDRRTHGEAVGSHSFSSYNS